MTDKDIRLIRVVRCSGCGKVETIDLLSDSGWTKNVKSGKYYCPKCSEAK